MSLNLVVLLMALGAWAFFMRTRDERSRIVLLAQYLKPYAIEQLMESLTNGYLRALEQTDTERRDQIWSTLVGNEQQLRDQVQSLALAFASAPTEQTRVGKWPISIFYSRWLAPQAVFDLRKALAVHAHGITAVVDNATQLAPRDKAFTLLAELMLFQHTCHWYCKSLPVASARLLLRHQTPYAKVLASVSAQTRQAYAALTGR